MNAAEMPSGAGRRRFVTPRTILLAVFAFTVLTMTIPVESSPNVWSRMSLAYSIVERGELNIDHYLDLAPTDDWAHSGGLYYSNKAPGPALMAVPLYFVQHQVASLMGGETNTFRGYRIAAWVANAFLGVLPTMLSLVLLLSLLETRYGLTTAAALGVTATHAFASLTLPYSTLLFAHQTAAAFIMIGVAISLLEVTRAPSSPSALTIFASGLCFGIAVLADHLSAVAVLVWSAWLMWTWGKVPRAWVSWIIGGAGPAAVLAAYNHAAFGSPWIGSYSSSTLNPFFLPMIRWHAPDVGILAALTIGPGRGWFYATPVYVCVIAGLAAAVRLRDKWPELAYAGAGVVAGLVILSSWSSWHGGEAVGPRYLVWSLPFAALLLVPVARQAPVLLLALAPVSGVLILSSTVTNPMVPMSATADPYIATALPILLGHAQAEVVTIWSLLFNVSAATSFLLYLSIWIAGGLLIYRQLRIAARSGVPT